MRNSSGKLVIAAIFLLAIAAALLGIWYRHQTTHRALELWGTATTELIARAPRVVVLRFEPPLKSYERDAPAQIASLAAVTSDASAGRGILNIRHALLEDLTYQWNQVTEDQSPLWDYGLWFSDTSEGDAVVLFSSTAAALRNPSNGQIAVLKPVASDELRMFFEEQLEKTTLP